MILTIYQLPGTSKYSVFRDTKNPPVSLGLLQKMSRFKKWQKKNGLSLKNCFENQDMMTKAEKPRFFVQQISHCWYLAMVDCGSQKGALQDFICVIVTHGNLWIGLHCTWISHVFWKISISTLETTRSMCRHLYIVHITCVARLSPTNYWRQVHVELAIPGYLQ